MASCTPPDNKMLSEWIAVEHYRLHTVESWPASAFKQAALGAIHSALGSLGQSEWPQNTRQIVRFFDVAPATVE